MRPKDFTRQRDLDILRAFREQWHAARGRCSFADIFQQVATAPSARFWVSEERCAITIARIKKGDTLESMSPQNQEMYRELYRRYLAEKQRHPSWPLIRICILIVNQPAPSFYLTPKTVRTLFYRARRQQLQQQNAGRHVPKRQFSIHDS